MAKSKLPLFIAMAAGGMILSVQAQESGQSIIFSSPQKSDGAPSLAPQNPNQLSLPETLQAPPAFFQPSARLAPMPAAQQTSSAEQRASQNRKNWAFATPDEIFGVAASQQLLNAPDDDDKNQTPFERYLDRQTQARMGNTNAVGSARSDSPWNFSRNQESAVPFAPNPGGFGNPVQGLSRFLNGAPNDRNTPDTVSTGQSPNAGGSLLSPPQLPQPAKADLAQQAAMERFRQLLNPDFDTGAASPDSKFFPAPKVAVDPNMTQPDFTPNPAGASFTPVSSKIDRPAGLTPLPPAIPDHSLEAIAPPAWAPKPAPWLSQAPQPYAVPQRKF